uniref:serine C-palmitoyltransferase n=1 Tax=Hanusia phi TaxID=3032 RepID=A0A7S0EXR7_9CRYP|mmetsp:Transcript_33480/g.75118  ORF Transcript_33480/g.75118 Transcript_33480/m.75118 type:complete len:498 (+) Transcript_33480:92-1585(+)
MAESSKASVGSAELGFLLDPTVEQLVLALLSRIDVHFFVEAVLVIVIGYLLFQKKHKPLQGSENLTQEEVDALCEQWTPDPLVTKEASASVVKRSERVVSSHQGCRVVINGKETINFASFDFLNMLNEASIKDECEQTIRKYGVGSCGPRGFYGTIDVHLELERELAEFYGAEGGIIYSYDAATASSIIPAFLKRGDLVIRDEAISYSLQAGIDLSRAYVKEFRHNDMADLESILEIVKQADAKNQKTLNRRFIVVEGLYQNTGMICPLQEVVELAKQYKFRVLLDESMALGTLGETGKGSLEHWGIPASDVTIRCGSMSNSLASIGGFAVADGPIIAHQRLSSTGYVFSASLPPFNATAAIAALRIIRQDKSRIAKLRENSTFAHGVLRDMTLNLDKNASDTLWLIGDEISPVKHLHLQQGKGKRQEDDETLQQICDIVLDEFSISLVVADYSPLQKIAPRPSIRITINSAQTREDIKKCAEAISEAARRVFARAN